MTTLRTFAESLAIGIAVVVVGSLVWASCTDGERCIGGVTEFSSMPCRERK